MEKRKPRFREFRAQGTEKKLKTEVLLGLSYGVRWILKGLHDPLSTLCLENSGIVC